MKDIIKAILAEDLLKVKEILEETPSKVDELDKEGIPAPFLAAYTGNIDLVRYIVEYSRASMNLMDWLHRNILHYAAQSNSKEVVKYLVERVGMDPLCGDKNQITPFELAHTLGNKEVEEYFEEIVGAKFTQMYKNPIRAGAYPDPSIVRVGEDYYMVNSSFTYFPCIPISHSKDLINWHIIGHGITNPEYAMLDKLESGRGYWAPDISYYEGKFYITATYRLNDDGTVYRKQVIMSSDKPEGPYSQPVIIDEDGIDPSIFRDDDGRCYMLLNRGARIFELNKEATKQIGDAKLIWYGDQKRAPEGPHLLQKGGYYYLFVAEGGTGMGHRISVARSKNLMGPYETCPYNPIMRQMDEEAAIQRAGHGKPVQTQNGEWYMVYLCGRRVERKYTVLGRETALDPITWTKDGWPIVNGLKGPSVLQKKPKLVEKKWQESTNGLFNINNTDTLDKKWMWVRAPKEKLWEKVGNKLKLYGGKYDLNRIEARSILVQRQTHFNFTIETSLSWFCPFKGQEVGLTCYYDENTYLKYGIKHTSKGIELQVVEHVGENETITFSKILPDIKEIKLKIDISYLKRKFYYSIQESFIELGLLENVNYLCDEGYHKGKRFTGAMVGIYAVSDNAQIAYGEFEYFKLTNK